MFAALVADVLDRFDTVSADQQVDLETRLGHREESQLPRGASDQRAGSATATPLESGGTTTCAP